MGLREIGIEVEVEVGEQELRAWWVKFKFWLSICPKLSGRNKKGEEMSRDEVNG